MKKCLLGIYGIIIAGANKFFHVNMNTIFVISEVIFNVLFICDKHYINTIIREHTHVVHTIQLAQP